VIPLLVFTLFLIQMNWDFLSQSINFYFVEDVLMTTSPGCTKEDSRFAFSGFSLCLLLFIWHIMCLWANFEWVIHCFVNKCLCRYTGVGFRYYQLLVNFIYWWFCFSLIICDVLYLFYDFSLSNFEKSKR